MEYAIFEGNMERLHKKLTSIGKKCKAYGCEFSYSVTGETFKEVKDEKGRPYMARFLLIEAEGTAIINDWEFVAAVDHTENGNIFRMAKCMEIPEHYRTNDPICEHCNSNRFRKYTYIIRNTKTGEFKQVGKSCLRDFTHGLSAEMAASYMSLFDTLIEGEAPYPGIHSERYFPRDEYLAYVAETIKHFGYVKRGKEEIATVVRAFDYYEASHGNAVTAEYLKHLQDEMESVGFSPDSSSMEQYVQDMLHWVEEKGADNTYYHNLKTACSLSYVAYKHLGLLASLPAAYERELQQEQEKKKKRMALTSHFIGQVGEKVSFQIADIVCVASWDTQYGTQRLYKMTDSSGNVYVWKTSKFLNVDETMGKTLLGKIKQHTEYHGVQQTELNYCKVL